MTEPGNDDHPPESADERDRDVRPATMRSVKRTEEEPGNWDDRDEWLRENVPPHHI